MSNQTPQYNKVFSCMTCHEPIKLTRKANGQGWDRWNIDGGRHTHNPNYSKKEQPNSSNNDALLRQILERLEAIEGMLATR
jgi:hypothetical protein